MADIHVRIKGDNADFERKLKEASEKTREFAEQVKEVGTGIAKEAGFGTMAQLLGAFGIGKAVEEAGSMLIEAAKEFGEQIVDAIKDGLELAGKTEVSRLRFTQLSNHDPAMGQIIDDWAKSQAKQSGGDVDQFREATATLLQAGIAWGQTPDMIKRLQDVSAGSGIPLTQLTEWWGRGQAEGWENVGRHLREMPVFESELKKENPNVDLKTVNQQTLEQMLLRMTTNQGTYAGAGAALAGTTQGKRKTAADAFEEDLEALGEELNTQLKPILGDVIDQLTLLQPAFKMFGDSVAGLAEYIYKIIGRPMLKDLQNGRIPGVTETLSDLMSGRLPFARTAGGSPVGSVIEEMYKLAIPANQFGLLIKAGEALQHAADTQQKANDQLLGASD